MRSAVLRCGSTYYRIFGESIVAQHCPVITYLFEVGFHKAEPLFNATFDITAAFSDITNNYRKHQYL